MVPGLRMLVTWSHNLVTLGYSEEPAATIPTILRVAEALMLCLSAAQPLPCTAFYLLSRDTKAALMLAGQALY